MDNKEKLKRSVLIIIIIVVAVISIISARERRIKKQEEKNNTSLSGNYNIDLIQTIHKLDKGKNYLISPYNIEIGLNMLRDGSDGETKVQIDKVLGNRVINDLVVKDKISIANGVFIKNIYKDNVKNDYYNILNTKYKSEIIYDEFKTPDKINNWVNEKTNGMIPRLLEQIEKDYVMGLASALAIDVKWINEFECHMTKSEEFTKIDNTKINVEMMHDTYETSDYQYIKTNDAEGIIIPYQSDGNSAIQLEFIGLIPNDNVDDYINNLTKEKLDTIDKNTKAASDSFHINLSLPRFKYDYEVSDFIKVLENMGINDAFNPAKANFKKMIEINNYNVYVGKAIHKTHIEVNEVGTKAAAITYFGMFKNSAMVEEEKYDVVNVVFNKPFAYIIREKNTKEILFFGVTYEPNIWNGGTCEGRRGE